MSKETNLTSLKVYGNDDPAGSVYKVSGGGSDKMALRIVVDGPDSNGHAVKYLTYLDGSSVTWEEIYDVMLRGITPVVVASGDQTGTWTGVSHTRVFGADIVAGLYRVGVEDVDADDAEVFSASTESDRLEIEVTPVIPDGPHV